MTKKLFIRLFSFSIVFILMFSISGMAAIETDNLSVAHKTSFQNVSYTASKLKSSQGLVYGSDAHNVWRIFMTCTNPSVAGSPVQLWTWNGNTDAASIQQANSGRYTACDALTLCNDALYLIAKPNSGDYNLVKVNTVSGGSYQYQEIFNNEGGTLALQGPAANDHQSLKAIGNKLFMYCKNINNNQVILRIYDTVANTWSNASAYTADDMLLLGSAGNKLYYSVRTANVGKLYVYDIASNTETAVCQQSLEDPKYFAELGGIGYFSGKDISSGETRLWSSDGTTNGTLSMLLADSSTYQGDFKFMVNSQNRLFIPLSQTVGGSTNYYLFVGRVNSNGFVTGNNFSMINLTDKFGANARAHRLNVMNSSLFFQLYNNSTGVAMGYCQTDGTAAGTVKISSDSQKAFTTAHTYGALGDKILVNDISTSPTYPFVLMKVPNFSSSGTANLPKNLKWAGLRASYYGIMDKDGNPPFPGDPKASASTPAYEFPQASSWEAGAKAISSYFPASKTEADLLWIVTRPRVDCPASEKEGCVVQMKRPLGISIQPKIYFVDDAEVNGTNLYDQNLHDRNEEYLDYFDKAGIKLWIQVEPGWAPMDDNGDQKGLMSIIVDYLIRQDQDPTKPIHECITGFGLDVEWFRNNVEGASDTNMGSIHPDNSLNTGYPVVEKVAQWYKKCIDNNLKMYIKHYSFGYDTYKFICDYSDLSNKINALGTNYTGGIQNIMFVCDSQGFRYPWDAAAPGSGPDKTPLAGYNYMFEEFTDWVNQAKNTTYKSPVGFQVAYPNDWVTRAEGYSGNNGCGWLNFMDVEASDSGWLNDAAPWNSIPASERWKIIPKLGLKLAQKYSDRDVGLFIVDFRARLLFENTVFPFEQPAE